MQGLREKERKKNYLLHVWKIFRKGHLRFSFYFLPEDLTFTGAVQTDAVYKVGVGKEVVMNSLLQG